MAENKDGGGEGHNSKKIDFGAAARIMKSEIAPLLDRGAKDRGDISAAKKRLEDIGVNKRGAAFMQSLLKASPATASDILRTVVGLCEPLGLGITRDMVDQAQGVVGYTIPLINTPSVDA